MWELRDDSEIEDREKIIQPVAVFRRKFMA